jgi:hypothetical protein
LSEKEKEQKGDKSSSKAEIKRVNKGETRVRRERAKASTEHMLNKCDAFLRKKMITKFRTHKNRDQKDKQKWGPEVTRR